MKVTSQTIIPIKDVAGAHHVLTIKNFHLVKAPETDSALIVAFRANFTSIPQISSVIHALNAVEPAMRTLNSNVCPVEWVQSSEEMERNTVRHLSNHHNNAAMNFHWKKMFHLLLVLTAP